MCTRMFTHVYYHVYTYVYKHVLAVPYKVLELKVCYSEIKELSEQNILFEYVNKKAPKV